MTEVEIIFVSALDVVGLTPGKEYKFRVSAVNSEGESEPLVADQTIIAKNPFGKISTSCCIIITRQGNLIHCSNMSLKVFHPKT